MHFRPWVLQALRREVTGFSREYPIIGERLFCISVPGSFRPSGGKSPGFPESTPSSGSDCFAFSSMGPSGLPAGSHRVFPRVPHHRGAIVLHFRPWVLQAFRREVTGFSREYPIIGERLFCISVHGSWTSQRVDGGFHQASRQSGVDCFASRSCIDGWVRSCPGKRYGPTWLPAGRREYRAKLGPPESGRGW